MWDAVDVDEENTPPWVRERKTHEDESRARRHASSALGLRAHPGAGATVADPAPLRCIVPLTDTLRQAEPWYNNDDGDRRTAKMGADAERSPRAASTSYGMNKIARTRAQRNDSPGSLSPRFGSEYGGNVRFGDDGVDVTVRRSAAVPEGGLAAAAARHGLALAAEPSAPDFVTPPPQPDRIRGSAGAFADSRASSRYASPSMRVPSDLVRDSLEREPITAGGVGGDGPSAGRGRRSKASVPARRSHDRDRERPAAPPRDRPATSALPGLNPFAESRSLRLLTYEACLRLCFAARTRAPEAAHFIDDGFAALQASFGVDGLILKPMPVHDRTGSGRGGREAGGPASRRGAAPACGQALNTRVFLGVEFTSLKTSKPEGFKAAKIKSWAHTMGLKAGRPKGLLCEVRLSSWPEEERKAAKLGPGRGLSLPLYSSAGAGGEARLAHPSDDVLEVAVKDKAGRTVGVASAPLSSLTSADLHGGAQVVHMALRTPQGHPFGSLTVTTTLDRQVVPQEASGAEDGDGLKGVGAGDLDANRAYDVLLQVALAANRFEPRHLLITRPWHFLLNEFAGVYNISTTYCVLQFLKWVVRAATPTPQCLDILCKLLPKVLKDRSTHPADLQVAEQNMLSKILHKVEELLARSFQSVKSLSDKEPTGICGGYSLAPPEAFPSPVLPKLVFLYAQLHDMLAHGTQKKMVTHLQTAANLRFARIKRDAIDACTAEQRIVGDGNKYLEGAKIFDALIRELEYDQKLAASGVLPSFVDFARVSSAVYAERVQEHLKELLDLDPPTDFSDALDALFRSASLYESALARFGLREAQEGGSVFVLFNDHVEKWIARDCDWLCAKVDAKALALEASNTDKALSGYHSAMHAESPHHAHAHQAYVIQSFKQGGIFDKVMSFVSKYGEIVKRWPDWLPVLEQSCCDILRALLQSTHSACAPHSHSLLKTVQSPVKHTPVKRLRCKSHQTHCTKLAICDTILLNALRQMLSFLPKARVAVSALSGGASIQNGRFKCGVLFRHVEEEVRTSYAQATQRCVVALAEGPCTRLRKLMKEQASSKVDEREDTVKALLRPHLDMIDRILSEHRSMLSPKVWRDLCRGIWDLDAAEVLRFVEKVHGNRGPSKTDFHVRMMLSEVASVLEDFFKQGLHHVLGADVHERDLQIPSTARKLRERLCGSHQNMGASDSFSVY